MQLPYLTGEMPGIGGRIKENLEDFQVAEVPLYPFDGQGTHLLFLVRKAGIPTAAAVERIARHMGVRGDEIGLAGLKDAQAVTTQWMSLEHADEARLLAYRDSQVHILQATRHTNKLRPGHLAGNRFVIRIRGAGPERLPAAQAVLAVLARRGVPNFFGEQRFGLRGDTGELGRALMTDDLPEFVAMFLGRARPQDPPDCKAARDAFDAGFHHRAMDLWPRHYHDQRRALAAYRKKQRPVAAVSAIDKRMKRLFVSAFQSQIFNQVLVRRIDTLDQVLPGDLAVKHDSGGVFLVEDAQAEQPRAQRFEISPTGPIPGYRASLAQGAPGQIELDVLAAEGMKKDDFLRAGSLKIKGSRRPLRFQLLDPQLSPGADDRGEFLEMQFSAASGCYATVALREIMKADVR